jgi:hypothetical protein
MLHLLLADGSTRLVPEAITARLDENNIELICVNEKRPRSGSVC